MSRPDGFAMHQAAKRVAPEALPDLDDYLARSKRKVVAVEKHSIDWRDESHPTNERFLWIKARGKITVKQIRDSYIAACGEPTSGLILKLGKQEPDQSAILVDLDTYGDNHVVFTTQTDEVFSTAPSATIPVMPSPVRSWPITPVNGHGSQPMPYTNAPLFNINNPAQSTPHMSGDFYQAPNGLPPIGYHSSPMTDENWPTQNRTQPGLTSRSPGLQDMQPRFSQYTGPSNGGPSRGPASRQSSTSHQQGPRTPDAYQTMAPAHDGMRSSANSVGASPSVTRQEPAQTRARNGGIHTMGPKPDYLASRATSLSNGSAYQSSTAPAVKNEPLPSSQEYSPRPIENNFEDEPDQNFPERGIALQKLLGETVPERLEAAVRKGVKILSDIKRPLETLPEHDDVKNWLDQIETVRAQAMRTRTVVGVVGNTGAGKSSVINAMLDEERLVPTNCMRACTAVVTELSYNDSKNPNARYRAEIEFIKPEDWLRELNILHTEVFEKHTGAFNKEATNPDTDAGVAWAKIKAVYYKKNKDQLAMTSPQSLMQDQNVKSILGSTRRINSGDCATFYNRLQHYVDSKDKVELDKNGNKKTNPKRHFEFWPLIKVVKVYTKAEALSTGAVLVDLPGVHDSNAARAAVAEGYMKQCTGLWIVAPINRAIDDKAAKNLLGDSFKRQLKFDGTYSCVTFICSKTDDISRTEASDSLQLGSRMSDLEDRISEIIAQKRVVKKELSHLRDSTDDHEEALDQIDQQIDVWEALEVQLENGETVYPPTSKNRKRKRSSGSPQARKKGHYDDLDDDSDGEINIEGSDPSNPLTADEVESKLEGLKKLKKEARREKVSLKEAYDKVKEQMTKLEKEEEDVSAEQDIMCIKGRNEYSRGAIQQDFAAGIRELDQEDAELEDVDGFNPDEDLRDYDEVARLLPVFCVSSRAYQKLSGRLKKDNAVAGFTLPDQTEIPQLQAHCKKLTENGRQAGCRRFLNALNQLLNSLSLWASDDGTGVQMTSHERTAEKDFLAHQLKALENSLEKGIANTVDDATETLDEYVFKEFTAAVKAASSTAVPTAENWGAHRKDGGLFWATYKAIVRRYGIFNSASGGQRDFNNDLVEPLYKHLATTWEKAFQRRLPHILQGFTKVASKTMKEFHEAVERRGRDKGHGLARILRLKNSLTGYEAVFNDLAAQMIGGMNEAQREVNREFTPVIAAAMTSAYETCTAESGSGSFRRMKTHMVEHVSANQVSMFEDACAKVKASLTKMCNDVRENMLDRADEVYVNMSRDYMTLIGVEVAKGHVMPREERAMRRDVDTVLDGSDAAFQEVVHAEVEELDVGDESGEMDLQRDVDCDEEAEDAIEDDNLFDDGVADEEGSENADAQHRDHEAGDEYAEDGLEEKGDSGDESLGSVGGS